MEDARRMHGWEDGSEPLSIIIKKARLAERVVVKWQRRWAKENRTTRPEDAKAGISIKYSSRLLECTAYGEAMETKKMQLRTRYGYRAIHCPSCKKQQVCTTNKCQCGTTWHLCKGDRIDPAKHLSRKAPR